MLAISQGQAHLLVQQAVAEAERTTLFYCCNAADKTTSLAQGRSPRQLSRTALSSSKECEL